MTKQEFDAWWLETKASENKWNRDEITGYNTKRMAEIKNNPALYQELFYTGGEDGVYITVNGMGIVEVGEYQGAYPHIGEAMFIPKHTNHPIYHGKQAENFDEAFGAIMERLGISFLVDLCRKV